MRNTILHAIATDLPTVALVGLAAIVVLYGLGVVVLSLFTKDRR